MSSHRRCIATVFAAGAAGAIVLAPVAGALPDCTNTGPNTTQCSTPGHTQITTGPPPMDYGPWYGWPAFGGWGISIGW
jgi:hypothetical protein